jgi:peroxiredoxin
MHNSAAFRFFVSQWVVLFLVSNFACNARLAYCEDPVTHTDNLLSDEQAGHSSHGEVFDEGPRQAAYLMPGMSDVHFPVTCSDDLVQRFFNQGVSQLHGFWYYEAERSFRQAAVLDPDCAMGYWGMAMANVSNLERARKFIAEAVKRRESATDREKRFIDGLAKFITDTDKDGKKIEKKSRAQQYTRDLETIVEDYPEDLEAKAFLALQLWENERSDLPIISFVAINSLLQEVFNANPMHPAHHYRIHLWDRQRAEMALDSAAKAGPSLPGIAHMWHMPGHIYSKLNRYQDAVWQQEASARVDHAHMMRDRVMPDQIHNFAHNNEWLIRNLVKIGRVHDALDLAKNMLELPRHPKYNSLKSGSSRYGRERLQLVLTSYRLWPELIELAETIYFEPTVLPELQVERLRHLGIALALTSQSERLATIKTELEDRLTKAKAEIESLSAIKEAAKPDATKSDAKKPESGEETEAAAAKPKEEMTVADKKKSEANRKRRQSENDKKKNELSALSKKIEQAIAAIEASVAANSKDWPTALKRFDDAGSWDMLLKSEWLAESNEVDKAIEVVDKEIKSNPNEVLAWSTKVWIQANAGNTEGAKKAFEELRSLACTADLSTPMLARHAAFATELGIPEHWATTYVPAKDIGARPDPDSLGSFRWHPYMAPQFEVQKVDGQTFALSQFKNKPTIVFFYLGFGCLHCIEQLHAFSPVADKFRESGVEMVAISSENLESLKTGLDRYSKAIEIPLHADPNLTAFKSFRCFDDFELKPLHGTFLIDHNGRVLWQDIGSDPFKDVDFLTNEAGRLLKISGFPNTLKAEDAEERD